MGDVYGLPVGLLFMASAFAEPDLFAIGYAYEQVSRHRMPPSFRQTML
jgi:amidase